MCLWGRGSPPAHHSPSSFFPSFFPPLLTATEPWSPPAYAPLGCRTTTSTLDTARAIRLGNEQLAVRRWWSLPTFITFSFYLCRHTHAYTHTQKERQEGGGKKPQLYSCQCICSVSSSFSPLSLWAAPAFSLSASLHVLFEWESKDVQDGSFLKGKKLERYRKC